MPRENPHGLLPLLLLLQWPKIKTFPKPSCLFVFVFFNLSLSLLHSLAFNARLSNYWLLKWRGERIEGEDKLEGLGVIWREEI